MKTRKINVNSFDCYSDELRLTGYALLVQMACDKVKDTGEDFCIVFTNKQCRMFKCEYDENIAKRLQNLRNILKPENDDRNKTNPA